MKSLVTFYSRTGTTRKVAESISNLLGCDVEEVHDTKNRAGPLGWMRSGRDAGSKALTTIEPTKKDPGLYDLVIIGTPVWNHTMSTPIRTYLAQFKQSFKQVAFFCTQEGSENSAFKEMESLCNKKPVSLLALKRKQEVEAEAYLDKVKQFVDEIVKQTNASVHQDD